MYRHFIVLLSFSISQFFFLTCADLTRCTPSTFDALLTSDQTIEAVDKVASGASYGEGSVNLAYPWNPTNLPELCAVTVRVESSPNSTYRVGVFLPSAWKGGRVLTVGNGGFGGGINWLEMGPGAKLGFATASTDTGHNSVSTDVSWALGSEEKRQDWGWRSIHGTVSILRSLAAAYYDELVSHSYYSGCSTGGRQGLRELQAFPESFDGALIGAPSWDPPSLNPYVARVGLYNLPTEDPKHVGIALHAAIGDEVVRQCDELDGVRDGIVSDPEGCAVDFDALACGNDGVDPTFCLSEEQVQTVKNMYGDYEINGDFIYSGYSPGSEDQWYTVLRESDPTPFGVGYAKYFVYDDPDWTWQDYNDTIVARARETDPGSTQATQYDLSEFKQHGGKILMYHGLADGLIPEKGSLLYYERVAEATKGNHSDFFRYFRVPGMQHCAGSAVGAPWSFGGAFQATVMGNDSFSVSGFVDAEHDMLLALVEWTEGGGPVDKVVATAWGVGTNITRQRPLCAYPDVAVWDGEGDVDVAGSWTCGRRKVRCGSDAHDTM